MSEFEKLYRAWRERLGDWADAAGLGDALTLRLERLLAAELAGSGVQLPPEKPR